MQRLWYVKEEKHTGSLIISESIVENKVFRDKAKAEKLENHMKSVNDNEKYFYETRMLFEV